MRRHALPLMQDHLRIRKAALTDCAVRTQVAVDERDLLKVIPAALPVAEPLAHGSRWFADLRVRRPLGFEDFEEFPTVNPGQDMIVEQTPQFLLCDPLRRRPCHG